MPPSGAISICKILGVGVIQSNFVMDFNPSHFQKKRIRPGSDYSFLFHRSSPLKRRRTERCGNSRCSINRIDQSMMITDKIDQCMMITDKIDQSMMIMYCFHCMWSCRLLI